MIESIKSAVIEALKQIYDPEVPVSIYDMGLIYEVYVTEESIVTIHMTLTTPACPVAQSLPSMVENAIKAVEGVKDATVILVWDPPWTTERMSEVAKVQLGLC